MTKKLQWIWNRIPKLICRHLIDSFDKKINLIKDTGERANKRVHREKGKTDFTGKIDGMTIMILKGLFIIKKYWKK